MCQWNTRLQVHRASSPFVLLNAPFYREGEQTSLLLNFWHLFDAWIESAMQTWKIAVTGPRFRGSISMIGIDHAAQTGRGNEWTSQRRSLLSAASQSRECWSESALPFVPLCASRGIRDSGHSHAHTLSFWNAYILVQWRRRWPSALVRKVCDSALVWMGVKRRLLIKMMIFGASSITISYHDLSDPYHMTLFQKKTNDINLDYQQLIWHWWWIIQFLPQK